MIFRLLERFKSEKCNEHTKEFNKIALSADDDERI